LAEEAGRLPGDQYLQAVIGPCDQNAASASGPPLGMEAENSRFG
jgi:hypothetical protein